MNPSQIEILPDPESLSDRASLLFTEIARVAIKSKNQLTVCLSGGTTPLLLYSKLAQLNIRWDLVHLFWGDERCVPIDSDASNFGMARRVLIDHINIAESNIHRMRGELPDRSEAAHLYEQELRSFFGTLPRFDLIYLGLGEDGHTASLFPGDDAINEHERWVLTTPGPSANQPSRLTLTFPVLNAAANLHFLISGAKKAPALKRVLEDSDPSLPASLIHPASGHLLLLIDSAAASAMHDGN